MDSKLFRKLTAVMLFAMGAVLLIVGLTVGKSDVYGMPNQPNSDGSSDALLCGTPWTPRSTATDASNFPASTLTDYGVNICKESLGIDSQIATVLTVLGAAAVVAAIGFTIGAVLFNPGLALPPETAAETTYPAVAEVAGHKLVTNRRKQSVFLLRRDVADILGTTPDTINTRLASRGQTTFEWNDHGSGLPLPVSFVNAESIPWLISQFPSPKADALLQFTKELTGP